MIIIVFAPSALVTVSIDQLSDIGVPKQETRNELARVSFNKQTNRVQYGIPNELKDIVMKQPQPS